MKTAVLAFAVLLSASTISGAAGPRTVQYECHYQAQKLERLIVLRASGESGPGQAYLLAVQALQEENRDTEQWHDWMKKSIRMLWENPNSVFFSPSKSYQEYGGRCLAEPAKFLVDKSVIK